MTNAAPPSPATITPTQWMFGHAITPDGQKMIVLDLHTVVGMFRFFMSPDEGLDTAAKLAECSNAAKAPVILQPVRHLMGPDGRPIFIGTPAAEPPPSPNGKVGPLTEQINDDSPEGESA